MKVGIVGTGLVGATAAYSMVMRGVGREIVLVDRNKKRALAEANDILHAVPFSNPLNIHAGEYADLVDANVVVICAGVGQKPGETRLNLLKRNQEVFQSVIPSILEYAPNAILLVASNPVDVMTHLAAEVAAEFGVPSNRVMGTGTTLDTARLRSLLAQKLNIDAIHVHGYVLGEHGDSEIIPWSEITVGVIPLKEFCDQWEICLEEEDKKEIEDQVRNFAYQIIEGKGATYYGVGSAITRIVEVILGNQRALLTVCTPLKSFAGFDNVTIALPHLVGGEGIINTLRMPLTPKEEEALHQSAAVVHAAIQELKNDA